MEKNQKIAEVAELKETFAAATSAVVIEFKGLVVEKDTAFRKSVRESKAQYRVSKNTLLRLAVGGLFREGKDPLTVMKWKELYEGIEEATDRCEDVANILEGVVLEYA